MSLNLNVGVLGHVNAGKTSLTKILSEIGSTAAFDKNPQSKERGITLDLGFSAFTVDMPEHIETTNKKLQFTLVDCPGHAGLIKTIIGGAQIIDFMLLIIDVTKGFQTQTAECIVIGEITCKQMIVVLNKIDLLEKSKKDELIKKVTRKVQATLSDTAFKSSPIIGISTIKSANGDYEGINSLIDIMKNYACLPIRRKELPFLTSIDHCFGISGQGTIMTGTILQGTIDVNDIIDIPILKTQKKIKSMQMFKKSISTATAGDRVGICITQLDPKLFERGIICKPEYITEIYAAVVQVERIKYYKNDITSKSKFHITIGHDTVLGTLTFFGSVNDNNFNYDDEYLYQNKLYDLKDSNQDIVLPVKQYALIEFASPVLVAPGSIIIGSKLDSDVNTNSCRLAFWATLKDSMPQKDYSKTCLSRLKVYKLKSKSGIVERATNEYEVIIKNLFKKETNLQVFMGLKVTLSSGESGIIESSFGQSGKVKIRIPNGLDNQTYNSLLEKKNKNLNSDNRSDPILIFLQFKKYIYEPMKKIIQ